VQPFGPDDDLTVWFGASPRSRKIREIRQDNRVTVTFEYADEAASATLLGEAAIRTDLSPDVSTGETVSARSGPMVRKAMIT
jgi:general stress protein 26